MSRYKDHSERLYEQVKGYADRVFLMIGNNSKKEHKCIREQMQETSPEETLALVATGSLIGEGFDFPRLDTLIMATPVSFQSVVEQYAGRLNRDYAGKKNVIVYDYVDAHIPMFDKMYLKRLKAYRQIGYELCSGLHGEKQDAGSIFDGENYRDVFKRDLLEAERRRLVSGSALALNRAAPPDEAAPPNEAAFSSLPAVLAALPCVLKTIRVFRKENRLQFIWKIDFDFPSQTYLQSRSAMLQ